MSALWVPRLFVPRVIRGGVAPGKPGAYALGDDRGGFVVGFVGRSDACLRSRLLTHNYLFAFEYFVFQYAADADEAFDAECELFHVFRQAGVRLCNVVPPAVPSNSDSRCRYCSFLETRPY